MMTEFGYGRRQDMVQITYHETGEVFEVKKYVAIPIIEALRVYQKMKDDPESANSDIYVTSLMLNALSEITAHNI